MTARRVPADACVVVYAQAEMLRLMAEGVPAAEASAAGFALFGELVMMTTGGQVAGPARQVTVPTRCLAQSAGAVRDALAMPWEDFTRRHGDRMPSVELDETEIQRLVWLADAARRLGDGVELLDAVRQAADKAEGKPRQRRQPAGREWLVRQVITAQDGIWWALTGQRPFSRPLPSERPAATIEGRW